MHQLAPHAPVHPRWEEKYREAGLVVVGIQTPEFQFEQNLDSVRREVTARKIDWPVAVDNQYEIWRASTTGTGPHVLHRP